MKILLLEHPRIISNDHFNDVANAPLSACLTIGYTAASLARSGHIVDIYDAYTQDAGFKACKEELLQRDFDLLGVHAVYFWEHTPQLFHMLEEFSRLRPEVTIVLFGIFPTFAFKPILEQHPFIQAIVIGEPEAAFTDLARAYDGNSSDFAGIAGIAFRENTRIRKTEPRKPVANLDSLPFPIRYADSLSRIGGSILGSRSCHGNCSFCCINAFYGCGPGRRCRSTENIFHEIEDLLPALDKKYLYFLDADFFGPGTADDRGRVFDIAGYLQPLHVGFGLECRAGSFDDKLLAPMANSGLKNVFLGIESASPAALKRMRKGVQPLKSVTSVQLLRSYGIEPNLGFIMFESQSRLADIQDNFNFLRENQLLGKLDVTANVLYHREISLLGMQNYDTLSATGRLECFGLFGYEGMYQFLDASVQFLSDLMSTVCRRVLRSMENTRSPICWKHEERPASKRVNDYLVNLFAETLHRLELQDMQLDPDCLRRCEDDAVCVIEGLIVEDRVCQS